MNSKLNPANVSLGSVSHGTMREEDLIPAFMSELYRLKLVKHDFKPDETLGTLLKDIESRLYDEDDNERPEYYDSEAAHYDLEALFDALDGFSPPYVHFGSHEGDGSDYGYWICFDSIEDDVHAGELERGDETPEPSERPEGSLYLHVNERGNCELYSLEDGAWVSVWSCV